MVRLADTRPFREGISRTQFLEQLAPDEDTAEAWFMACRWPNDRIDVPNRIDAMTAVVIFP